jgi:transglutaminase-like putative cysteine protease
MSAMTVVMLFTATTFSFADTIDYSLDVLDNGSFRIQTGTSNDVRVFVTKGDEKALYTLKEDARLPLQFGNGIYNVTVYEKINGRFKLIDEENIPLDLEDSKAVYLNPVQNVNFNEDMAAIRKARELTEHLTSQAEKIEAIHQFVINHVAYDYQKARTVTGAYVPSVEGTFETGTGICYDYASLMAGMLRSVGVPTKVSVGYVGTVYHAWNEIHLEATDEWITVDATQDAIYHKYGLPVSLSKTSDMYQVKVTY